MDLITIIKNIAEYSAKSSTVVPIEGEVIEKSPLKIKIQSLDNLEITSEFIITSPMCNENKLWYGLENMDIVQMIKFSSSLYMVMYPINFNSVKLK